jgi:hypothetical protein
MAETSGAPRLSPALLSTSEAPLTVVRRPNPLALVLDLTRRLAEEFDTVPIPMVTRTVRAAAEATRLFGEEISGSMDTIERIARADLAAIRDAAEEQARLAFAG